MHLAAPTWARLAGMTIPLTRAAREAIPWIEPDRLRVTGGGDLC